MGVAGDNELFDDYFDSIFKESNDLSEKGFNDAAHNIGWNFREFLPEDKSARILDVGCGCGHFLFYLKKQGYTNMSGIDISRSQVDFCAKRTGVSVEVGNACEVLIGRPRSYDLISMMSVLEHLSKDKIVQALKTVHAALKEGGTLIIEVPNMASVIAPFLRYRDFTHECGFTEISLYQVLWMAGFRNIELRPMLGGAPKTWKQVIRIPLRWLAWSILKLVYRCEGYYAPRILTPGIMVAARKSR